MGQFYREKSIHLKANIINHLPFLLGERGRKSMIKSGKSIQSIQGTV